MEILNKSNYDEFDEFCQTHPNGAFQQSPRWAKVKSGWDCDIVVIRDENQKIKAGIMVLIRKMGIKTMMYANRGPVCDYNDKQTILELKNGIKLLAKKHKAFKFVMDPLVEVKNPETVELFKNCGFTLDENPPFHKPIQPRFSYMLRYLKGLTYDELLTKMSSSTRYYMRFPEKKGVICERLGLDGLDAFYDLYSKTGDRQQFSIRAKSYFENMLTSLGDNCRIYMCSHEGDYLCGGVAVQYGDTVSHVYGCSNDLKRNLNPTYLLQVNLMKWALETNCNVYDMQGVAPTEQDDEVLYRVFKFKSNFTGEVVETCGEFSIVFDSFYDKAIDFALKLRKKLK